MSEILRNELKNTQQSGMIPLDLFFKGFCIMVTELDGLFRGKVGFLCCLEMFFHLFYDMLSLGKVLNFQVRRCLAHLMCMSADRAELPALETVDIGECPASRAPDDEVHGSLVMGFVPLKIYRPCMYNVGRIS